MLEGSCHCGAVRIELARRPRKLTECNCSICRRYGVLWSYFSRKSVTVSAPKSALCGYKWGDRRLEFFHCRTCGCVTHYEMPDKSPDGRMAVNARMLEPADIRGIPRRKFDGAVSWKTVDEWPEP